MQAVIFDMDGLIIDSEPFWQQAEIEIFRKLGLNITSEDTAKTQGMPIVEVAQFWFEKHPWPHLSCEEVGGQITEKVIDLVTETGVAMPGAKSTIENCRSSGLPISLATSSSSKLIAAVLKRLDLTQAFDHLVSAENEPLGKPHPGIFLTAAKKMDVKADQCLVLEDSIWGVIAAKAAKMKVIAVPSSRNRSDPRFSLADTVLNSLDDFTVALANKVF